MGGHWLTMSVPSDETVGGSAVGISVHEGLEDACVESQEGPESGSKGSGAEEKVQEEPET